MNLYFISLLTMALAASLKTCESSDQLPAFANDASVSGLGSQPVDGSGAAAIKTLGKPEAFWALPAELREVSAIAVLNDDVVACIQDEDGIIFMYDLNKKAVVDQIKFAGAGDYEGIAVAGNTAYVIRSDGAIFEVTDFRKQQPTVKMFETKLAETQDTEGLAYDQVNNRLLIACKGYDVSRKDAKGIYAFSLKDKTVQQEPVISITMMQQSLVQESGKKKNSYDRLQPSTLEIHPVTGELYTMDAENFLILVLDDQGLVKKIQKIDKQLFEQPEAISFGSKGEMYIASEGSKKSPGILVKYKQSI